MTVQVSAVNTDAESGNVMEITVFDGKTAAHTTEYNRNVITVSVTYFHE